MDEYVVLRATMDFGATHSKTCLVSVNVYSGIPVEYFCMRGDKYPFGWDKVEEVGRIEITGDVKYLGTIYKGQTIE